MNLTDETEATHTSVVKSTIQSTSQNSSGMPRQMSQLESDGAETVVLLMPGVTNSGKTSVNENTDSLVDPEYRNALNDVNDQGEDRAYMIVGCQSGQGQEQLLSPASGGGSYNPKITKTVSLNLKNLKRLEKHDVRNVD